MDHTRMKDMLKELHGERRAARERLMHLETAIRSVERLLNGIEPSKSDTGSASFGVPEFRRLPSGVSVIPTPSVTPMFTFTTAQPERQHMTMLEGAAAILRGQHQPVHIEQLVKTLNEMGIGNPDPKKLRLSLAGSLDRSHHNGGIFVRVRPGTYALRAEVNKK